MTAPTTTPTRDPRGLGPRLAIPLLVLALLAWPAALAQDGSAASEPAPPPAEAPTKAPTEAPAEAPAATPSETPAAAEGDAAGAEEGSAERRVITIDSSGGTQSGNLRYGPIEYQHPDPLGITAIVADLTILAPRALLEAPPDTLLSRAKGSRTATFDGGVQVARGRLDATGPGLVYEEATGLGLLGGGVDIVIAPQNTDDDPTEITAESVEFDVDTDRSVSRGGVVLISGSQRADADALTYAEERDLGRLVCEGLCTIVREDSESGTLTITAEEIRVLTGSERLWARGNVTVVDDAITSTGSEVFYDDEEGVAEVLGSPARSVDEANGIELESDRIQQFVDLDYVEAIDASLPREETTADFLFAEEGGAAPAEPAEPAEPADAAGPADTGETVAPNEAADPSDAAGTNEGAADDTVDETMDETVDETSGGDAPDAPDAP